MLLGEERERRLENAVEHAEHRGSCAVRVEEGVGSEHTFGCLDPCERLDGDHLAGAEDHDRLEVRGHAAVGGVDAERDVGEGQRITEGLLLGLEQGSERLRDRWPGKLVIKGIVTTEDAEQAIACGVDGMIVSNHGGRQLDAGQSTIKPLAELVRTVGDKTTLMIDSGVRSGPDVACALASGAKFTFMGRSFMYGVCAMGNKGGEHTIFMLKRQLQQVMEQIACERVEDFPKHLIRDDV